MKTPVYAEFQVVFKEILDFSKLSNFLFILSLCSPVSSLALNKSSFSLREKT